MATTPTGRRHQLLALKRRIERQLRELDGIRTELQELNADEFSRPVAADDHPWVLKVEPTRRELRRMLVDVCMCLSSDL